MVIGVLGAVEPLRARARQDAALALYPLSLIPSNMTRLVRAERWRLAVDGCDVDRNAVAILVGKLREESGGGDKAVRASQTQHNGRQPSSLLPRSSPKTPFLVSLPTLRPSRPNHLSTSASASKKPSEISTTQNKKEEEVEEEVEEDMLWIQEKALDLVEFTGSVTQAIPGPRVGSSKLPWMLAVPLAYAGVTSIDELLLQREGGTVSSSELKALEEKTGFNMVEILRKYIRYALNEKPFNPDLVASLIHLRRASGLDDSQIPEVLNEISRRIVKEKGPVVMNMQGFTEKGFKRKLAVQALFGKIYYLSELPDFCSKDNSLIVKEIFGVTDEDAEKLRIHALAEAGDIDSLEKMVEFEKAADSSSDTNEEDDTTTTTP
ncbi:hypothetical protein Bca4012_012496 [Brassica carinata]